LSLQGFLQLDRERSQPLYQQIAEQIKVQISDGRLPIGTRLPTVRQLASTLGVTRLTIHSAYSELQSGGWVEATVGRGTFVAATVQPDPFANSLWGQLTADSVLESMPRITQAVGLRSMAYADPDPILYPAREFWESLLTLRNDPSLLQYGSPQGDPVLRVELAALLADSGIEAMPDEILVTAGVSQGLSLVAQTLARPGDYVAVEQPTYLGMLHKLKEYGLQPLAVPLDDEGPVLDSLEKLITRHRPRFFYTISRFHNPTGVCISAERQRDLLALAERHGLIIVEDDVYGRLSYDGPVAPPIKAADKAGIVIYLDSMSKVMVPGVRIGYVVAPAPYHERLMALRRANDMTGPMLIQRTVADFLHRGRLRAHLRRMIPIYRERRDALLRGLQYWMPDGVSWTRPTGGLCCWVTLPGDDALSDLYQAANNRGIVFTPGEVFMAEPDGCRHMRICYGNQPPEVIRDSVAVLGELIRERIGRKGRRPAVATDWVPLV
jgi:DNA-binding transcriptional MocR family regulator